MIVERVQLLNFMKMASLKVVVFLKNTMVQGVLVRDRKIEFL